jgi:asparagine synthetase B (glutamine-hydrolysing)
LILISITPGPARATEPLAGLAHRGAPLGVSGVCDIFYDPDRYEIEESATGIRVRHRNVPDGDIFRMRRAPEECELRKPLMLGLPLYYSSSPRSFVASTHVRLLKAFGVPVRENRDALPEFFLYRYVTPPRTLFEGIQALPIGGRTAIAVARGEVMATAPTWTDVFRKSTTLYHLEESAARIKEDLERSIQSLRPHADGLACLMSGGVDSSILFKLCQDHLAINNSHSTGYPFENEAHNDERRYALSAADTFGSRHTYHSFSTQEFLRGVIDAINHAEVPLVAMQSVLLELVFNRELPERQKIVVCGQGADSVFGLSIMYHYQEARRVIRPALAPVFRLLANTLGRLPQGDHQFPWARMHAFSKRRWDLDFGNLNHGLWLMGEFADKDWVKSQFGVSDEQLIEGRRAAIGQFSLNHVLDAFTVLDFVSDVAYMQDVWGKLADARGRWVQYPFNSPELIRVANHTPWEEKMAQHKLLLRRAGQMAGVPDSILFRPKRTFGVSAQRWATPGGILESLHRVASPVIDLDLQRRFLGRDERRAMTGWTLANYAIWKRIVINGEPVQRLVDELLG